MFLVKLASGNYIPSDDKSYEESSKIAVGTEIRGVKARNIKFHRKAFALMNLGFSNQDKFESFEVYRKVIIIRAGYFDEAPTKHGEVYYIAKSLSFENMSANDFDTFYESALNVISGDLETAPELVIEQISGFY